MVEKQVEDMQQSLHLTVLGSGYVGLPTAAIFANAGFNVIAVDIKPEVVQALNDGVSPISEPGLNELLACNIQAGRLRATVN